MARLVVIIVRKDNEIEFTIDQDGYEEHYVRERDDTNVLDEFFGYLTRRLYYIIYGEER